MPTAKELKEDFKPGAPRKPVIPAESWLSTGCSLLNLAASGRVNGGIAKGSYTWFCGDSESGKTWFALTVLAEAVKNKNFNDYRFIFDNAENGALMDIERYFGARVLRRIEPPKRDAKGKPQNSETVQDFYFNLDTALRGKKPFIYILDSMDALDERQDREKFEAEAAAFRGQKGKKVAGSFGGAIKAKVNSDKIKRFATRLDPSGSILLIISQTRHKINDPFGGKTAAGGDAMKFYAHLQLWTTVIETVKTVYKGRKYYTGSIIQVGVRKNRFDGGKDKVEVPFVKRFGFDDVGGNVDYLTTVGHWDVSEGVIEAPEFKFSGTREKLIGHVESSESERELQLIVQRVWQDIDAKTTVQRKKRYL